VRAVDVFGFEAEVTVAVPAIPASADAQRRVA
jgi:hypothetical protein